MAKFGDGWNQVRWRIRRGDATRKSTSTATDSDADLAKKGTSPATL